MANTNTYTVQNYDGAFNDIGLVDLYIYTPMGTIQAKNLGPADVSIAAEPGNGGNLMNIQEGAMGQLLANKSYKVKNWGLSISFLRHSLDYCKGTYLIQEMIAGHITTVGIKLLNRNFGASSSGVSEGNTQYTAEELSSDCAFLVNFPGIEAGAGANGDYTLSFKLSNADFVSGTYRVFATGYDKTHTIPAMNKGRAQYKGDGNWDNSNSPLLVSDESEIEWEANNPVGDNSSDQTTGG